MPLLRQGRVSVCNRTLYDGEPFPDHPEGVIFQLQDFLRHARSADLAPSGLAIRLGPADDPSVLRDYLGSIDLIEIDFPKYTDGRGYSIAQLLRRRFRYSGELRAIGHVLRDQLALMKRAGFDAVVFDHPEAESEYAGAVAEQTFVYQPSADGAESIFVRRSPKGVIGGAS